MDTEIDVKLNDVIYITGDSGSGKSSILREFEKIFADKCVNINKLQIDESKPLVDTVGADVNEALGLLSRVGLNDAFLFIRKYPELSDSQKYRYRLAKLLESGKQIWICDEFCSTLDRDTAKIVSYNVQRFARKFGKGLFIATCNRDLRKDLNSSVYVAKRYGKEIAIEYAPNEAAKVCSLRKQIVVEEGTREDWKKLARFHYRTHRIPPSKKFFRLTRYHPFGGSELVGVIVYSYAPIVTFGRRQAFGYVVKQPELNERLSIISRVVVHPKYRTIGLGKFLVQETLPLSPTECVETIAVMAKYNPFFERAGMKKIAERVPNKKALKTFERLQELGFDRTYMASEQYNLRILESSPTLPDRVKQIIGKHVLGHARMTRVLTKDTGLTTRARREEALKRANINDLATLLRVFALMNQRKFYLFWRKSNV